MRLPRWLSRKESTYKAGDMGSIPGGEDPLKKEMAIHYTILAWKIPWTEEPGKLQSVGLQRVRHDSATKPPPPHLSCEILGVIKLHKN